MLLPRDLIFLASLWLVGSWVIGVRVPVLPSSATYAPGVRVMLMCVATGLMVAWPLLRLSQSTPAYPLRQTLLDLVVLLSLVQVVLWPLRLVTNWTPWRTAALDGTIAAWTVLAGAVVGAAIASHRAGPRAFAMLVCLALCLLGPALAWLGVMLAVDSVAIAQWSPLMSVRSLAEAGGGNPTRMQWAVIGVVACAAAAAWAALVLARWQSARQHLPDLTT